MSDLSLSKESQKARRTTGGGEEYLMLLFEFFTIVNCVCESPGLPEEQLLYIIASVLSLGSCLEVRPKAVSEMEG
jgi:hypothetical protein